MDKHRGGSGKQAVSGASSSPFARVETPALAGPVVVEVPHAGVAMEPASARFTRVPERALVCDSDIGAGEIFGDLTAAGATSIVAAWSRYVIDLNTAPRVPSPYEDKLPPGLREVRRRSASGEEWFEDPPPREEVERRVREILEPYHAEVAARLAEARERHGAAILVSAHSYPDSLFPGKADVVIGTRKGAAAGPEVARPAAEIAAAHGLSVALDDPFPGGLSLRRHARPETGVRGVQIEIARRLVCDPGGTSPRPEDVERLRAMALALVRGLAAAAV